MRPIAYDPRAAARAQPSAIEAHSMREYNKAMWRSLWLVALASFLIVFVVAS